MLPEILPKTRNASIEFYFNVLDEAAEKDKAAKLEKQDVGKYGYVHAAKRWLARNDLFFLLTVILGRKDINKDWLFDRCREVQAEPNGYLDLWAREHYKSTIITYGMSIQDILASHGDDPEPRFNGREVTIGIFSQTQKLAADFLDMIKREFENNQGLKRLFPDILWERPTSQAPVWSKTDGITVKRKSNTRETTVEAWGMVDGLPTGKHFINRTYDDVVTEGSVKTPDQIAVTTKMWELSQSLGTEDGYDRLVGTRYHQFDSYQEMIDRGSVKVRLHPCTLDGTDNFDPENCAFRSPEFLKKRRQDQGPYTFGAQMLMDPTADSAQGFKEEWLRYWPAEHAKGMNVYILVDPASGRKIKESGGGGRTTAGKEQKNTALDYTVIEVVGLGPDGNYYTLDRVRDRLNLTERGNTLLSLHRQWKPLKVGYQRYGLEADIEFIKHVQDQENYRFDIEPVHSPLSKSDRIKRLIPIYEGGRWFEAESIVRTDWEHKAVNLTKAFIREEYTAFPVCKHDDILDCKATILDLSGLVWPKPQKDGDTTPAWMKNIKGKKRSWQAS